MDYDNVCLCVCIYVIAVIYIYIYVCVYYQYETDRTDTEQKKILPKWIHRHSLLMQNKTLRLFPVRRPMISLSPQPHQVLGRGQSYGILRPKSYPSQPKARVIYQVSISSKLVIGGCNFQQGGDASGSNSSSTARGGIYATTEALQNSGPWLAITTMWMFDDV